LKASLWNGWPCIALRRLCFSKIRPGRTPVLGLLNAILAATPGRIFEKQNGSGNGHPLALKITGFMTHTAIPCKTADSFRTHNHFELAN